MTTRRTIKRRQQRQRAKSRRAHTGGPSFITPEWVYKEMVADLQTNLMMLRHINRTYNDPTN